MATRRKVEFQGTFDIQAILSAVDTLQNRLNQVQLSDNSTKKFEKSFNDLKKRAQEINTEIKQGFTSTSQINSFNNSLQKMSQQMELLKSEINSIDTSFNNLQLNSSIQKQFETLKISANSLFDEYETQISNIESKISSFASQTGVSFSPEEISGLAQVISSEEELAKLKSNKIDSLQEEKRNVESLISTYKDMLNTEEQSISSLTEQREGIRTSLVNERFTLQNMEGYGKRTGVSSEQAAALSEQSQKVKDLQSRYDSINNTLQKHITSQDVILSNLQSEERNLTQITSNIQQLPQFFSTISGQSSGLDDNAAAAAQEFSTLRNTVIQLEQKLEEANAEIQQFKTSLSQKASNDFAQSASDIDRFNSSVKRASDSTYDMGNNLERLNKQDQFFENLSSRATAIFGLSNAFIYVNRFIRESVDAIKELDAAFTEIAVVTNMTSAQLWESFDTYNDMAQRLGTTTVDAIQTSALYYQQGLETAEVMQLTEETMKMARIAGMDYAEATDRMTAAIRGFKLEMEDAQRVNDVFSELAAITASDTDELSSALTRTASIASSAGMSLETTTAFLAQMINFATYTRVA